MASPDQVGSPFRAAGALPIDRRYGGRIAAMDQLPIHALGNQYVVDGNGTVTSLPALPIGETAFLQMAGAPTFTNSTRLICPNSANYIAVAGDFIIARSKGDGIWQLYVMTGAGVIGAVRVQRFTVSGTYTPDPHLLFAIIEGVGPGGGGGSAAASGASAIASAGGGGGGSFARKLATAAQIGASQVVTIGAPGTGGTSGSDGSDGGTTSAGSLLSVGGGKGGIGCPSGTTVSVPGGAGGIPTVGDDLFPGSPGGNSFAQQGVVTVGGIGGASGIGSGGASSAANAAGIAATGFGGGGGGGSGGTAGVTRAGGNGAPSFVKITEFCLQ